jgi:outer membrane protein
MYNAFFKGYTTSMKRSIFTHCLTICGFLLLDAGVINAADTLSLGSFVSIAVRNNPQTKISKASVQSAIANQKTALSRFLPHIGANAQAGLSQSQVQSPAATGGEYSAGVSVKQLIFDFGTSWFSNSASLKQLEAARQEEKGDILTLVLNAETAYFTYLLSQKQYSVAQEALVQYQAHLEQAKVLFETGKQARLAVSKAEVDVADASVKVITAKNGVRLAKVQMEVAAGTALSDTIVATDSLDVREQDIPLERALSRAMEARPELAAQRAQCEAARLQLTSAKTALLPDLNASASSGYRMTDWIWNYSVGVNLSASIYEGALAASVSSASASYDQAKAQLDLKKQAVASEVEQDFYEKAEAFERIAATKKLIDQAVEGLELSQQRFIAGLAPSLEVTDAEATLASAKSSHAQALFDFRTAHAKLVTAMGGL